MAPEVLSEQLYSSVEMDVFACGIVLFIMVAGYPPFLKADLSDPYYRLIINGTMNKF